MTRSDAIYRAKEAYRLYLTRAIVTPGLTIHVWGYCFTNTEWEVCLTNEGKLDAILRRG